MGQRNLKYISQAWQATTQVEERHDTRVWEDLWKSKVPIIVQEFIYKLFLKKLAVADRVVKVKEVKTQCPCCEARETVYHFLKTCSITRMLVHAIRCLAKPRVENTEIGRLVRAPQ